MNVLKERENLIGERRESEVERNGEGEEANEEERQ